MQAALAKACVNQNNCTVSCSHGASRPADCCQDGVGTCCGCEFSSGAGSFFVNLTDPCPGKSKQQAFQVRCNNGPSPGADTSVVVQTLKVSPPPLVRVTRPFLPKDLFYPPLFYPPLLPPPPPYTLSWHSHPF